MSSASVRDRPVPAGTLDLKLILPPSIVYRLLSKISEKIILAYAKNKYFGI